MKNIALVIIIMVISHFFYLNAHAKKKVVPVKQIEGEVYDAAIKTSLMHEKVLRYQEEQYGVNSIETVDALEALAWINTVSGELKTAEILYKRVVKIRRDKMSKTPENNKALGISLYKLGDVYYYRKRLSQAQTYYNAAIDIQPGPVHVADILQRLSIINMELDNNSEAVGFLLEAQALYKTVKKIGQLDPIVANNKLRKVYNLLSEIYRKEGEIVTSNDYKEKIEKLNEQNKNLKVYHEIDSQ